MQRIANPLFRWFEPSSDLHKKGIVMSTRRGFLKLLGIGAGAAVAAPVAGKALDVLTQPGTDMYLNNRNYSPSTKMGPHTGQRISGRPVGERSLTNPHNVTKEQVGLGSLRHHEDHALVLEGMAKRIR